MTEIAKQEKRQVFGLSGTPDRCQTAQVVCNSYLKIKAHKLVDEELRWYQLLMEEKFQKQLKHAINGSSHQPSIHVHTIEMQGTTLDICSKYSRDKTPRIGKCGMGTRKNPVDFGKQMQQPVPNRIRNQNEVS